MQQLSCRISKQRPELQSIIAVLNTKNGQNHSKHITKCTYYSNGLLQIQEKCSSLFQLLLPNFQCFSLCPISFLDCERSLLSAGLDLRACERKEGTADNTSRNEIRVAHTTQNSHWSKSIRLSIKSDM
jgi:hypothetical protein